MEEKSSSLISMTLFIVTSLAARRCCRGTARYTSSSHHKPPASLEEAISLSPDQVETLRHNHFSSSCSISYKNTGGLHIIGGYGSRLIDVNGNVYLDTRNNVAHIGHGHPEIVDAVTYVSETIVQHNVMSNIIHYYHVQMNIIFHQTIRSK